MSGWFHSWKCRKRVQERMNSYSFNRPRPMPNVPANGPHPIRLHLTPHSNSRRCHHPHVTKQQACHSFSSRLCRNTLEAPILSVSPLHQWLSTCDSLPLPPVLFPVNSKLFLSTYNYLGQGTNSRCCTRCCPAHYVRQPFDLLTVTMSIPMSLHMTQPAIAFESSMQYHFKPTSLEHEAGHCPPEQIRHLPKAALPGLGS